MPSSCLHLLMVKQQFIRVFIAECFTLEWIESLFPFLSFLFCGDALTTFSLSKYFRLSAHLSATCSCGFAQSASFIIKLSFIALIFSICGFLFPILSLSWSSKHFFYFTIFSFHLLSSFHFRFASRALKVLAVDPPPGHSGWGPHPLGKTLLPFSAEALAPHWMHLLNVSKGLG